MYRVLVVEDEHWIRKATIKMIGNIGSGFEVVGEAENGEEAWTAIQKLWPSIVIADIMMPEQDGLTLIKQIYDHKLPIVSIVISGFDNFQYAQQAMRYEVSEYLLKPLAEEDLRQALLRSNERLTQLKDVHQCYIRIEDFIHDLPGCEPEQLSKASEAMLDALLRLKGRHSGIRSSLISMWAGRWEQLLKDVQPDYTPREPADHSDNSIKEYMRSILHEWLKIYPEMTNHSVKRIIQRSCDYILQHYREELTVSDMAEQSNLSSAYFSVLFKRHTGETFVYYLNSVRVNRAKELLLSDMKIYEVALEVGFTTVPYFNRVFKQITNLTPNEYRKGLGL